MPGFKVAIERALADNVVTLPEWQLGGLRSQFQQALANKEFDEIRQAFELFTADGSRVVMPAVLADLRSLIPADYPKPDLVKKIIEIGEDQYQVCGEIEKNDTDRNGLSQEEFVAGFFGTPDERQAYHYVGVRYLRVRLGIEPDRIRGGANLCLARWAEGKTWVDGKIPDFMGGEPPNGLGAKRELIAHYQSLGIEKPRPKSQGRTSRTRSGEGGAAVGAAGKTGGIDASRYLGKGGKR